MIREHSVTYQPKGRLMLELDSSEVYPDNPGNGTPAMVYVMPGRRFPTTFFCALDTGELDGGESELSDAEWNWLQSQEALVERFIQRHSPLPSA